MRPFARKTISVTMFICFSVVSLTLFTSDMQGEKDSSLSTGRITYQDRRENERIHRKIRQVRERALKIRIDGYGDDWRGIPKSISPAGNVRDSSRDITATAIAPLEDRLLIALFTRSRPTKYRWSYFFDIFMYGISGRDFGFGIHSDRTQKDGNWVIISTPHGKGVRKEMPSIKIVMKEIVEISIPWKTLYSLVPGRVIRKFDRPFVRLRAFSNNVSKGNVDYGNAIASYKLHSRRYKLDIPLKRNAYRFYSIPLPVRGRWYVSSGAWSGAHQWAYEIHIRDSWFKTYRGKNSKNIRNFYAWNQPVYAPQKCTVRYAHNSTRDNMVPFKVPDRADMNNGVWLILDNTLEAVYVHMKHNGVVVRNNQKLNKGQLIGYVGNSGYSAQPHIHMGVQFRKTKKGLPMKLKNVIVGINTFKNDPWNRRLQEWIVVEDYFVQAR